MKMTFYRADCIGNERNCLYPYEIRVQDEASLRKAVSHDYVTVSYENGYRGKDTFRFSDCLAMDCDNAHSDDPEHWATPESIAQFFQGVTVAFHFSRNHMKDKGGKSARPRFHCFFAIEEIRNSEAYCAMKHRINALFPFFDGKALDSARFFFGTSDPRVQFISGDLTLDQWLTQREIGEAVPSCSQPGSREVIPEGSRNSTLSPFAARLLKRMGNVPRAKELFLEKAKCCNPPLPDKELEVIWRSALRFYERIRQSPDYIPPEEYDPDHSDFLYQPSDQSDVGEARVLADVFQQRLRYSTATGFLVYNGDIWEEDTARAHALMHNLTDMQLEEAENAVQTVSEKIEKEGISVLIQTFGKKASDQMNDEQKAMLRKLSAAEAYHQLAMRYRRSLNIKAVLTEVQPMVSIRPDELDAHPFLLNTPKATYDLREGLQGARPHQAEDFLTLMTSVDPGENGKELWQKALNTFFQEDRQLMDYVQLIAGLIAIGKVFREELIIAYGDGRNGKSTFWNVISKVLGTYAGSISADALTVNCKRNVKPELAEIKGKRMIIAAELEEGMRMNTAMIKGLCSTDRIKGEKKYLAPFDFEPSHTAILHTNYLPKVSAKDAGIWRRLIVVPFNAKIEGSADRKNYTAELFEKAGEAILSWIIEGAYRVIRCDYKFDLPACVKAAIDKYRDDNDWLSQFLEDCCLLEKTLHEHSGDLYAAYREYCLRNGEYIRSTADFYLALDRAGYDRHRTANGVLVEGLRLKPWNYADEVSEAAAQAEPAS